MDYPSIIRNYSKALKENIPLKDKLLLLSIFQVMYRFFDAENSSYKVLHASAAISNEGNTILFGDDGKDSIGKTFCSLLLASKSSLYISDEYCLINPLTNSIFGNASIPINLKGETAKFFKDSGLKSFNNERIIFADDYFRESTESTIDFIVIPYMNSDKSKIEVPDSDETRYLYKSTMFGHNAKLLNPELDKVSLLTSKDTVDPINMSAALASYPDINLKIPLVKMYIKEPKDTFEMLEDIQNGG